MEVRIYPHGVEVVDLETKNGTHYQGARIRELAVRDEVVLMLGKQVTVRIRVGGGESAHVILDTPGVAPGTYFLYTTNLNFLNNFQDDFGGMMTEIRISAP